jgi:hypothetical protein
MVSDILKKSIKKHDFSERKWYFPGIPTLVLLGQQSQAAASESSYWTGQ